MPTYNNYVAEDYWISGYAEGDIHSLGAVSASNSADLVAGERVRLASSMASSTGTQLTAAMSKFFLAWISSSASATASSPAYIAGTSGTVSSTSATKSSANILVNRAAMSAATSTVLLTALIRFNPGVAPLGQSTILATPEQIAKASLRVTGTSTTLAAGAGRYKVAGAVNANSALLISARILWEPTDPSATPSWGSLPEPTDNWILIPDNSNNWTPLSN